MCSFWRGIRFSGQKSWNLTAGGQTIGKTNRFLVITLFLIITRSPVVGFGFKMVDCSLPVSPTFLNSSGTKFTVKKKYPKIQKTVFFTKIVVSRHLEVYHGRISTRRIRIWGEQMKNQAVRAEQIDSISVYNIFLFDHSSENRTGIWTILGGNCSQESPAAF